MSDPYKEAARRHRSRGKSAFARVALVLGGLLAVGVTAAVVVLEWVSDGVGNFAARPAETFAEMAGKLGSDVTVVSTDKDRGRVVLRVGDEGQLVTVDLTRAAADRGEASQPLPDWVPVYPETSEGRRLFSAGTGDRSYGGAAFMTGATVQEVLDWYKEALDGMTSSMTTMWFGTGDRRARIEAVVRGGEHREIFVQIGEDEEDGKGIFVVVYREGD